jgi:hypothetical protein
MRALKAGRGDFPDRDVATGQINTETWTLYPQISLSAT